MGQWIYYIDVVGTCNLRCPSCPVGNFAKTDFLNEVRPNGFMDIDLFSQIIQKIEHEAPATAVVYFYNWGEPLLHPKLSEFIRYTKGRGLWCGLSSNLNIKPEMLEKAVAAYPDEFRISASGLGSNTYEVTHRRGKTEILTANMRHLRECIEKHKAPTKCHVLYHVYKNNVCDDLSAMIELCRELNFELIPVWAYLMPLEKNLRYLSGQVSSEDKELIDRLTIDPREHQKLAVGMKNSPCSLQNSQMVINHDGSVPLCCAVYDPVYAIAPSFLDVSHEELQARKYRHDLCTTCMDAGGHIMATYAVGEELDRMGNSVMRDAGSPYGIRNAREIFSTNRSLRTMNRTARKSLRKVVRRLVSGSSVAK